LVFVKTATSRGQAVSLEALGQRWCSGFSRLLPCIHSVEPTTDWYSNDLFKISSGHPKTMKMGLYQSHDDKQSSLKVNLAKDDISDCCQGQ
jgi:hypothetical protein